MAGRRGWADEHELTHAVHGTIVAAAVMAAAGSHGTLGQTVVSVLVTLAVYWTAERYSVILAAGVEGPVPTRARVFGALREGWPMMQAAVTPLVLMVAVTWLRSDLQVGVTVALLFTVAQLTGLGWVAARHGGRSGTAAVGWALATGLLGAIVAMLKLLLH